MVSDEALMLAFQNGSREAFEEIFARYRGPIHGFFARRIDSHERAEDLLQETFLAVIDSAPRYVRKALVRTWLYGIAMKQVSAERRREGRGTRVSLTEIDPASSGGVDDAILIRQALQQLETQEREILMLREYEQLSYQEIADLLTIPVNTVRSRLFRARMALKEILHPIVRAKGGG
jgi:RNA polymerase sigma-70 factor (ECF subfamily)